MEYCICLLYTSYSDRWADPVQQAKPKAWENYTVEELEQAIADHTKDVLGACLLYTS